MKNVTFSDTGTCYDVTYLWVIALSDKVVGATSSEGFSGYKMNANKQAITLHRLHHNRYHCEIPEPRNSSLPQSICTVGKFFLLLRLKK